ncbi:MAG: phosphatase [Oscillospiraceae bacterium]|jgi:putative hydrolase|nr:phosphatase [Oscillospiraceae bacterium]
MFNIIADTHTHTLASDHAYSTLTENAAAASLKGLAFMAMTEHAPAMSGAPTAMHFSCLPNLPRTINGVKIIKGAEANIMDHKGALDLEDTVLEKLEWVIASMHLPVFAPQDKKAHTQAWMAIAENPLIDVIGHCGDGRYDFDEETVLPAFKKYGKIVEINAHSFAVRPGSDVNCPRIAKGCMALGIPVVVSSDAHFHTNVGHFAPAVAMLDAISFPAELILNADYARFEKAVKSLNKNRGRNMGF